MTLTIIVFVLYIVALSCEGFTALAILSLIAAVIIYVK